MGVRPYLSAVARVADGAVAKERLNVRLCEHLRHKAHAFMHEHAWRE